jgi:hypothetical protein
MFDEFIGLARSVPSDGIPLFGVIDMHAAAVSPKQVQLGTHRAALRMWISEDDGECIVWHCLYSL